MKQCNAFQTMIIKPLLSASLLCLCVVAFAQEEARFFPVEDFQQPGQPAGLYGRVVESGNNKGIQSAAVQLFVYKPGQTGESADSLVTGMLTKPNGDFAFAGIQLPDSFLLRISAVGYAEVTRPMKINQRNPATALPHLDVGNIRLDIQANMLNEVTVVARNPGLVMGIDRKVFNVDKSITSTGGTAVDVM